MKFNLNLLIVFFVCLGLACLSPILTGVVDMACWFWTGSVCSNLTWSDTRPLVAAVFMMLGLASFGMAVTVSELK